MMVATRSRVLAVIAGLLLGSVPTAALAREEVRSFVTHDGLEIGCVLSLPDTGKGPFPGMLLIPGSGLHDADVTLDIPKLAITNGEQTLFRPLARYFSRHGWAVQRCNKRGASFGHVDDRPWLLESATLEDLIEDNRQALKALHDHPLVDARPLVLLGHSEGAQIAVRLAIENRNIDLLVLMGAVARRFDELLEYQLVERNLIFFARAADRDGDGSLTLREMRRLGANYGLGSVYVSNSAGVLFAMTATAEGPAEVRGFHPRTDRNGDGRLHLEDELAPALRREAQRLLKLAERGSLGAYWQSLVRAPAPVDLIHQVQAPILFVHGLLDVQAPIDEPLTLMAALATRGRDNYDVLFFPALGHSLSPPNDFFAPDGTLTILDNLTFNAPRPRVRRQLLERIESNLDR